MNGPHNNYPGARYEDTDQGCPFCGCIDTVIHRPPVVCQNGELAGLEFHSTFRCGMNGIRNIVAFNCNRTGIRALFPATQTEKQTKPKTRGPHKCNCPINTVLIYGCQCNGV